MIANIITLCRIAACAVLFFLAPSTVPFTACYLFGGLTDVLDGFFARKCHTESAFGAKLDTFADVLFVAGCLIKILPVATFPRWIYGWIILIALIKACSAFIWYRKKKQLLAFHSSLNRITGVLLFFLLLAAPFGKVTFPATAVCVFATVAAVQECFTVHKERNDSMLKIENLTKCFGEKKAVDNLSLHIARGEIYGFIGHNGAGKTTTLKSIAGIMNFDAGTITIDGVSITENPLECKKRMAYIPDNPDLYDYMTGRKYLNFIADVFGISAEERREKIEKYAAIFELTDNLPQAIATYSHGMKQKLAIISAWIHSPKLILMDEPFVGLDPKASHSLKEMMREHCDNGGAIFFSTHVLEVAEKLCDKVAIIKDGKLIRSGTMEEVKGDESLESVFLESEDEK